MDSADQVHLLTDGQMVIAHTDPGLEFTLPNITESVYISPDSVDDVNKQFASGDLTFEDVKQQFAITEDQASE